MKYDKANSTEKWGTLWRWLLPLLLLALLINGCGGSAPVEDAAEAPEPAAEVEEEVEEVMEAVEEIEEAEEEILEEAMAEEEVELEAAPTLMAQPTQAPELGGVPTPSAQPTQAPEFSPTQAPELGESAPDDQDISATGSEEDEGSPFTGSSGQKGADRSTEAKIAWLSAVEEIDPLAVRVLADHADSLVIRYGLDTPFFEETVILTQNILFYSYLPTDPNGGPAEAIFLDLPAARWEEILETLSLDILAELSTAEADDPDCIDCPEERLGEQLTIITPDEVYRLNIEPEPESEAEALAPFIRQVRIVALESRVRVRTVVRQIE